MTSSFRTDPCVLDDFVSLAKFRALCKRVGVDPESARAVLLIEGAGGEATRAALAERLRLSSVEASRLIDNLESAGLASRIAASSDKRKVSVFLTELGWDACDTMSGCATPEGSLRGSARDSYALYSRMRELALAEGVTSMQALSLLAIESVGPATAARVASVAGLARTSTTEALKSLERKGLVVRVPRSAPTEYALA